MKRIFVLGGAIVAILLGGYFVKTQVLSDPAAGEEQREVKAMIARMSLEHKVAQLIMPDISSITPEDQRRYRFGTILAGGNSGPGGNDKAPAPAWLALADAYWDASTAPLPNNEPVIPVLWGVDAVHGHSNLGAATIFPHNIALGATRDAALVRRIGEATAAEVAATGIDWAFAPTLAVVTDDRWGRTYESFAQDPMLVAELGAAAIAGLQGERGTKAFLDQRHVIATAKHFFGDGGTGGKDRGDTTGDLRDLKDRHAAPYAPAFKAGAQVTMASFSSINGEKMHASRALLTDYLRGELKFDGVVLGDWNGHGEVPGCRNDDCPQALNAGLDIYMVAEDWKLLCDRLLAEVRGGTISMARLDEAVGRVLTLKLRYGLFTKPRPSKRMLAGQWATLGSAEHRALAREAVRKSLVLLTNDGVLPLKASATVLVAGAGADSIPFQAGGWSITWQGGGDLNNGDFPGATSIFAGIAAAMREGGGRAILSPDGRYTARPDVAIVVIGEEPYAEFVGDREDLVLRDARGLELLAKYKAAGIPTVAVLISGRPLWVGRELAAANAFVAAWQPGSEGAGVADVLVGDKAGRPRHDFTGLLGFGWPAGCAPSAPELFGFSYGSSYAHQTPPLDQSRSQSTCALLNPDMRQGLEIFTRRLAPEVTASANGVRLTNLVGRGGSLTATGFDVAAQEDARRIVWNAPGQISFAWPAQRLPQVGAIEMRYRVEKPPSQGVRLSAQCGTARCAASIDLTSTFTLAAGKDWRTMRLALKCLDPRLTALSIDSAAAFTFDLQSLRVIPLAGDDRCRGPF